MSTGFVNTAEAKYANTFNNRYPIVFVGKAEMILSTQVIKIFESVEAWRGNGIGDENKEWLLSAVRLGIRVYCQYCMENMGAGSYRSGAIRSGEFTLDF